MRKILLPLVFLCLSLSSLSQRLLSWTPEFPLDNSTVAITVDCNKGNQGLLNFEGGASSNVYVHVGVITSNSTGPSDWKYTKFTWGTTNPAANATALGNNKYLYTISNVRSFFGVPGGETILKICVIFRNGSGSIKQVNSDNSDMYIPVYGNSQYAVRLNLPPFEPRFIPWIEPINVNVGGTINITGVASASSNLTLKLNGTTLNTASGATTISSTPTITTNCTQQVFLEGDNGNGVVKDSFSFYVPPANNIAPVPAGMQEGINYDPNNTSATLVLYAPSKSYVLVIGDFNNWQLQCNYQMNRTADGNYYWLTINGLTPGTEYGYQYLVDNSIRIADPYTQKVLDPDNDRYIDTVVTYPHLKQYPAGLTSGIVGILQTAEPQYTWRVNNFSRPDKKNLLIYELLVRDFLAAHSYQSLLDSLNYLKSTGVNAIELMPVNEFDGNDSWGYNPAFYFAPDKYYGTKNKLKEFIDSCHSNGIAVILDVVFNHCTGNAPEAKLYWDAANSRPASNNPWLNVTAPHPYSVFNDFNHTSTATQYLVERSLYHWINEYKVDGYRFDLAKGFTQTPSNTTTVENYDPSRVANLERYYDSVANHYPNRYMILEFLGTLPCQEEQEYAAHGFMLWGNDNAVYNQCTMGFTSNSDISQVVYNSSQRAYNNPASVGYLESHDEERTMYKNINFGNSSGGYNVRNLPTALAREEAAAAVFFTVPGPKMIWQFEERGYDISIGFGGSNLADKPPHWEYMTDPNRRHLYDTYHSMMQFRLNYPSIFNNTTFNYDFYNGGGLVKLFQIADTYAPGLKVTIVSNLDVVTQNKSVTFQNTGTWTNYISNGSGSGLNGGTATTFNLASASQNITLQPGEYHIYTSGCPTTAPTVSSPVNYCQNATAVPLTANGTSLLWYTVPTGGTGSSTAPTPSTSTVGSTSYYVSQTANGCEGPRATIVVIVTALPAAPGVTSPVTYCQNATATQLTATGTNLLWYTVPTGGTGSSTAPTPSTTTPGSTTYYVSQTVGSCEGPRASITVNITVLPAPPGVTSPVTYCQNATASQLTATGNNLLWYTVPTGGSGSSTAPTPNTSTVGSTTYYVSQTVNNCEGPRAAITVIVNAIPAAPGVTTPVTYCQNATAVPLIATGSNLLWYTVPTGGTGSPTAPTPSTTTPGSTIYYVSQTVTACESPRASITVIVNALPAAPGVTSPVTYCQNATAVPLTATGSNLLWYTVPTGGTGSSTAPTPSTSTVGSTTYYVSQTVNNCEGSRASITVIVNALPAAPGVTTPVTYCQNATATQLTATGSNLLWYTVPTGGTGSATAPTPSTTTPGSTTYYVSQTVNNCEGPRASITVIVNATPAAPGVTTPVIYCQNATAVPLTASGSNLLWYTIPTGGTGSTTAPTPSTATPGSTLYYVSQTVNNCEGPRATITVVVNALPAAPGVTTPVTYCQNATAVQLTATGSNLLWYTVPTGGTGNATAPTPSTSTVGSTTYYVSQTVNNCEGTRASITVVVNALPAAPGVTTPVTYCQNATASPLTATGSNLLWYTVPTGGTGSSTAPIPSTSTVGSTTYYVSQSVNNCESPRASITVVVNPIPAAPGVTSPVNYCLNAVAVPLTANGSNLLWYTVPTGGTGSSTAPTPSTSTVGSTSYYVSQTVTGCESPRATITVIVTATTPPPTVVTPVIYCQNAPAVPLNATGTNLLWYTVPNGGTGSSSAPTPSTATPGTTTYYVSQTLSCGEGPRASIDVIVNAIPSAPGVTTPVTYCQNATASQLTANGSNLLWYTVPTGGTGNSTAPTPSTSTPGTTTYYVSQTVNGCEGPRASIAVNVTALPAAPGVTTPVNYCQNAVAVPLIANGSNLLWYTVPTGGTGSTNAPTPSTSSVGSTTYYVSQTVNNCEGPRASITVIVNSIPAAPGVTSPVNYCQNVVAVPLTANGSNLLWYTVPAGGTGSATAPTPSTSTVGSTTYYVSQTVTGCESPRASITVIVNAIPAAPGVTTPITYCQNAVAAQLTATGSNLLWYTVPSGGTGSSTAPTPSTSTPGTTTYYVSQSVNGCESPRASIVVIVIALPAAPGVTTPVNYCQNAVAVPLTANGTNLLWYTVPTGGTGSSTAPIPSTTTVGSTIYYVSQTVNNCEGPRASITVIVNAIPAAPGVTTPVNYCQNAVAAPLTANGTNLLWYTVPTGGTGSSTAPTPSTTTVGSTTYYVSQTIIGCESPRASITVIVNAIPAAPGVTTPVTYCQNAAATALTATGSNLLWYTVPTGGTGSSTAPVPQTSTPGSTTYYVSQTVNGCESPRASIVVIVIALPAAPGVTTPVNYCQNAVASQLTATGANLLWYTTPTGGTGSSIAPTPSTTTVGSTNYYVSQTVNNCEGPRATITVNVFAIPAAPGVTSPVNYCRNATATALTATGNNLLWYTVPSGGTGSSTAPIPSTGIPGNTTYYVSQTVNGCESPRATIVVTILPTPSVPLVTSPVTYCQNATAVPLTATGSNLLWYTVPTGGTGSSIAPTPSTTTVGNTTYYVSQTVNSCESPRTGITVTIMALPAAPGVTSPVNYCQNSVAAPLTATGTGLLWYTTPTGGTGSSTAPTPSTTTLGSIAYYVTQNLNGCESPRALINVIISLQPLPPTVTSPVTYCQNNTATALTATGNNLLWYNTPTGGTGSVTAPVPSTTVAGTSTYYVSQSAACGEGPRTSISVVVTPTPPPASGLTTNGITMNSAILNWTTITGNFYTVDYKAASSNTWINAASAVTTGSVTLNNLTIGTTYNWRVSVNCSSSVIANFALAQFTTIAHNSTIDSQKDGLGIKISPDPMFNTALIDYIVPANGTLTIDLLNSLGQQMQVLLSADRSQGQYQLPVTNQFASLGQGIYFLRIQQNGRINFTKFIKE